MSKYRTNPSSPPNPTNPKVDFEKLDLAGWAVFGAQGAGSGGGRVQVSFSTS